VADSDPEAEYEECVAKARGMLAALREAGATAPVG
jgi:anthranilate/para-aminobenzoate synthase component I